MAKKFTFRKEPAETGLAACARPYPDTKIKLGGRECGIISAPTAFTDRKWKIGLILVDEKAHCGWAWIFFKARFDTEPEARAWIIAYQDKLLEKPIHCLDD